MKNILIVDDNEFYLELVQSIVEGTGNEARCAANGQSALQMLQESRFSLLITDFNMPGMDGIQLAARAREVYPDIDIVMATGNDSFEVRLLAKEAGISRVVSKPGVVAQLLELLES